MDAKMERLYLDLPKSKLPPNGAKKSSKIKLAESWEDEDLHSDSQTPTEPSLKQVESNEAGSRPPPPTPISPSSGANYDWAAARVLGGGRPQPLDLSGRSTPRSDSESERRRPEKTTAAAGRMIAAGLGLKTPKKTEEQKQYDRSVKEQEIKRKNREKEAKEREREEDEIAKAAVWE